MSHFDYNRDLINLEMSIIRSMIISNNLDWNAYFKRRMMWVCNKIKDDAAAMRYLRDQISFNHSGYLDWFDKIIVLI